LNIWKRLIPFGLSFIGVKLSIFGANGDWVVYVLLLFFEL
jgi:hypothetical protein